MSASEFYGSDQLVRKQRGVTLLEVLVSLVLVAIVGITAASSSIRAQQGQQQAYETTLATSLGKDLIERVRANPSQLQSYQLDFEGANECPEAGDSLASYDLNEWCERAVNNLPDINVLLDPDENSFDLVLSWRPRLVAGGYFTVTSEEGRQISQVTWKGISARVRHE